MLDKIINILSIKYNLDPEIVEKVIRSEFDFVSTTMEQGNYESIRLHHLGVFGVKPKRLEKMIPRDKRDEYYKHH